MAEENPKCMRALCNTCRNLVFVAVVTPERQKNLAKEVASLIRAGLRPEQCSLEDARSGTWCNCKRDTRKKKTKQSEMNL